VLDVMLAPGFLEHVRQMGNHLGQQLVGLVERHPDVFEEVRGVGLMRGLKCKLPQADVGAALRARGLLTVNAGENVIRLMPPLIIEAQQITEAVDAIEAAAADLTARQRKAG
jgi:acetylornithine/N-succinyldiaminopimelate aminotransferase